MMSPEKIQHYKELLVKERNELEADLSRLGIKNPKDGDWGAIMTPMDDGDKADPNMAGDREEEFLETSNEIGEIETRYNEVKHALDKIESYPEKYGMCEVSNQPIEHDRLEANPAAKTCKAHMNQ